MSRQIPLGPESAQVTLDSNGNGQVQIGPSNQFQVWTPASVQIQVDTNVKEASFYLYMGSASSPANAYANSQSGSTGDTCGIVGVTLYPGQMMTGVWSGGDAGSVATMSMFGTNEVPR